MRSAPAQSFYSERSSYLSPVERLSMANSVPVADVNPDTSVSEPVLKIKKSKKSVSSSTKRSSLSQKKTEFNSRSFSKSPASVSPLSARSPGYSFFNSLSLNSGKRKALISGETASPAAVAKSPRLITYKSPVAADGTISLRLLHKATKSSRSLLREEERSPGSDESADENIGVLDISTDSDEVDHDTAKNDDVIKNIDDDLVCDPVVETIASVDIPRVSNEQSNICDAIIKTSENKEPLAPVFYQPILDAGQKSIDYCRCSVCGMLYANNSTTDVTAHTRYHGSYLNALAFPKKGWKKSVQYIDDGLNGVIYIVPFDTPRTFAYKKVQQICELVDNDLGFSGTSTVWRPGRTAFVYVKEDKQVAACCITEPINKGYRWSGDGQCGSNVYPASMGINRVWVDRKERRNKIATTLLDTSRRFFMVGCEISKDHIAFSDPTKDGKQFAVKYVSRDDFLVYQPNS